MIHTNRVVTVGDQESIIDKPIILYRGDREVEIEFELIGNEYSFTTDGNVIKSVNASHGQLVLNTPSGENMFSELAECHDGKVVFIVTKEMIDEFIEIGFYSFQIRLYDGAEMKSRVTIPPVLMGFDIRNPIASEDETNVVDMAIVDYARVFKDQSNEELQTFDWNGNYNKTEWEHHDLISENKMNKIEDALYTINNNVKVSDVKMLDGLAKVKSDADKAIKDFTTKSENNIKTFERDINNNVEKFKIDANTNFHLFKDETNDAIEDMKKIIYEEDWYNPNTMKSTLLGEDGIPSSRSAETYEGFFDWVLNPLVEAHPEYVTKTTLGLDQSGMYNIYRYDFTPKRYDKTVLLHGCLHGNEYTSFFGLCRFLQELCDEKNNDDPNLHYIKNHIKLVVCPILNPWGFIKGERQNVNGVDLNRNFDYRWNEYTTSNSKPGKTYFKGDAPFSEAESRIVRDMVAELNAYNLVASIDFHTITSIEAEKILYYPRFHDNVIGALSNVVERFSHGQNRAIFSSSTVPTLSNYLSWAHNICCTNPEWNNRCYGVDGARDAINMTKWVEWAGNILLTMAKEAPNRDVFRGGPFAKQLIFRADESLESQDENRMGPNGYNVINSSTSTYNSMEISKYEFAITQQYVLHLTGWIKIKAVKNTTLKLQPLFYQQYAPEQNYSTLQKSDINVVTMNLEEGKEYMIPVDQVIQGYHSNYNTEETSRSSFVHFRIRAYCNTTSSCYVNAYNITIHGTPSDVGQAVNIVRISASGYEDIFPLRLPEDIED